jgi:membrane glycosyltransferase
MLEGPTARGAGGHFHVYVLSDTNAPAAAAEDACFAALAEAWRGKVALTYRRREDNAARPAISAIRERWARTTTSAIMLDADSVMTVDLVLKLVRIMQVDPRLGILQSLVIGMPSASAFARIFQFGMRLGMRSYTIGSAWWQGDVDRIGAQCDRAHRTVHDTRHLPVLTEGALVKGHVLSHDQVEAVLMRRPGFSVCVLAEEGSSLVEPAPSSNSSAAICAGARATCSIGTVRMPGLKPVSRYQLAFAILMFIGSPAWIGMLLIGSAAVASAPTPADFMRFDAGIAALTLVLAMWFAPNIATVVDVARPQLRHLFGGGLRFTASFAITIVFVILIAPIMGEPHLVPRAPGVRPPSAGRAGATTTKCRGRWRCATSGRRPWSGLRLSCCLRSPHRRPSHMRCSLPAAPCSRSRSRW